MSRALRGLSEGLQTGLKLGSALRDMRQREELAKAYGMTPQEQQAAEVTPEQLQRAQAETQAMNARDAEMFGLTPEQFRAYETPVPQSGRVGMSTYRLGEQTLNRAPTQFEIDSARTRAAADVFGRYGDFARREELMRGLRAEERAQAEQEFQAQARPLTLESARLRVQGERRTAEANDRMDAFTAWAQANPDQARDFNAVRAKAVELRMTNDEQFKIASNLTGIDESEFKMSQNRIRKLVANQGLDGLLKAHKDSNDLDPGSHFETVRGRDGTITLNRVDTATGRIIQPNVFSGKEAEVVGYLNKAAMDPATIVDYTMNLRKNQTAITAQEAATEASRATTALRGAQLTGLRNQQAGSDEAARIRDQYMELTPEEQAGPKGQGLIRQFNMANARAGATVPLGPAPKVAPELPAPVMKRYEELIKSDRWQRAPNLDAKIKMLEDEGISPAAVGLSSPTDALIDRMRRNAPPAARPQGTAAGQQLLGLADVMLPPAAAPAPVAPTTSRDRMRGLYLGQ